VRNPSQNGEVLRVLIANDRLGRKPGTIHGAGRLMIEWSLGFRSTDVQATACILRAPDEVGKELLAEGVPFLFFGDGRFNPASLWRFIRLIRKEKIDVLHLQGYGATTLGRIAGLLTSTPALIHLHSCYGDDGAYPAPARLADRLLRPVTSKAIAVSKPVRQFCIEELGFRPEQVEVLHNPVPTYGFEAPSGEEVEALRSEYGLADSGPIVGTISRLDPVKGIDVLIEALPRVLEVVPEARLLVVGDGSEKARLEGQARDLGLGKAVVFAGFRSDIAAHLRLFSLTAIPSVFQEPCPLSALESLAAGVPIVASRTGGMPELVEHGRSGLLVEPSDPADLAAAISRVLAEPALMADLRAGATLRAERFSLGSHLKRLERLYREAASGSAASELSTDDRVHGTIRPSGESLS